MAAPADDHTGLKFLLSVAAIGGLAMASSGEDDDDDPAGVWKRLGRKPRLGPRRTPKSKENPYVRAVRESISEVRRRLRLKDIEGAKTELKIAQEAASKLDTRAYDYVDTFKALRRVVADVNRVKVGPVSAKPAKPVVLKRDVQAQGMAFWRAMRRDPSADTKAAYEAFLRSVDPRGTRTHAEWDRYFFVQREIKREATEGQAASKRRAYISNKLYFDLLGKMHDPNFNPRITPFKRKKLTQLDNSRKLKALDRRWKLKKR